MPNAPRSGRQVRTPHRRPSPRRHVDTPGATAVPAPAANAASARRVAGRGPRDPGRPPQRVRCRRIGHVDRERAHPPDVDADRKTSAATEHGIEQITGRIRVLRGGRFVDEAALQRVRFDYPGIGMCSGRSFGHPEAVTLPLAYPDATESVNVTVGRPVTIGALLMLRQLVERRVLTRSQAARPAAAAERYRPTNSEAAQHLKNRLPPLFGWAAGTRDGDPAHAASALARWPDATWARSPRHRWRRRRPTRHHGPRRAHTGEWHRHRPVLCRAGAAVPGNSGPRRHGADHDVTGTRHRAPARLRDAYRIPDAGEFSGSAPEAAPIRGHSRCVRGARCRSRHPSRSSA